MFLHRQEPLPLSEACLHSLCASLNAPVMRIDELPDGPARAAIVIYAEEYGNFGLAVGLRSLESAQVALYSYRGRIQAANQIPAAMEDALCFAESLGFLFDEDMIEQDPAHGRRQALEHWDRLLGEEGEVWAHSSVAEPPAPELSADPLSDDELSDDEELLPPMDVLLQPAAEPAAGVPLTKFRGPEGGLPAPVAEPSPQRAAAAEGVASGGGDVPAEGLAREAQLLGRVAIVKVRRDGEASKPGLLTRLLGGF